MDLRELAGADAQGLLRRKAWEALGVWINSRIARQRGVYVPNLFQIYWKTLATDGNGSRLNRPVFVLSERFCENFGVKPAVAAESGVPAPGTGDEVNFYRLAIQHSEGLSKDQVFTYVRDMLFRLGDAAKQGREVRLDVSAGTLIIVGREASFEFIGGLGAGAAADGGDGERKKVSHLDPMLAGRNATGGESLAMAGHAAAAAGSASPTRRSVLFAEPSRKALSAEEEALFADVDALDPETVLAAAEEAPMRAGDLEALTRTRLGQAMGVDPKTIADRSIEDVGAELTARATSLEAQLRAQRAEGDKLEARLRAGTPPLPLGGRVNKPARVPPLSNAPKPTDAAMTGMDLMGSGTLTGTISISGSAGGGSAGGGSELRGAPAARRSGSGGESRVGRSGTVAAPPPPPVLSIGFASNGPVQLGSHVPNKPAVLLAVTQRAPRQMDSEKVPTAPPLPPFRYAPPQPNDAANKAWKSHAAPQKHSRPTAQYGRAVGGPAPPFLAAPPTVAAALVAKSQGLR